MKTKLLALTSITALVLFGSFVQAGMLDTNTSKTSVNQEVTETKELYFLKSGSDDSQILDVSAETSLDVLAQEDQLSYARVSSVETTETQLRRELLLQLIQVYKQLIAYYESNQTVGTADTTVSDAQVPLTISKAFTLSTHVSEGKTRIDLINDDGLYSEWYRTSNVKDATKSFAREHKVPFNTLWEAY